MNCRQIKEELILLVVNSEEGQELLVAYRRHISACPECARQAAYARQIMTLARQRAARRAPGRLRTKILAGLPPRRG